MQPADVWNVCGTDLFLASSGTLSWWHCDHGNSTKIFDTQIDKKCIPVLLQLVSDVPDNNKKRSSDKSRQEAASYALNAHDASPGDAEARRLTEAGLIVRGNVEIREADKDAAHQTDLVTSKATPTLTSILTAISTGPVPSATSVILSSSTVASISDGVEKRENGRCVSPLLSLRINGMLTS